jgi:hypothetical protein
MLVPIDSQIIIFYAPILLLATEYKSQILKIIVIRVRFTHHNPKWCVCVCVQAPTNQLGLTRLGLETRPPQQERILFYIWWRGKWRRRGAAAGDEGGGGRSCHLNFQGARTMRANRYIGGGGAKFSSI